MPSVRREERSNRKALGLLRSSLRTVNIYVHLLTTNAPLKNHKSHLEFFLLSFT